MKQSVTRRNFIRTSAALAGAGLACAWLPGCSDPYMKVPVYGHLWVYASRFPPDWDCTSILAEVFSDFHYAGIQGVEVMESLLRNPSFVTRAKELVSQYEIPVTGTSYYGDFWSRDEHTRLLEDIEFVVARLEQAGGTMFGITVGDAEHRKTEDELDAQADLLKKVMKVCAKHNVEPNIHNHSFEVADGLHDLKGILARVPDIKLGPDLSWLARAGVDPVAFVRTYGKQMVYLHIRDQGRDNLFTEAVGEGLIDFAGVSDALREINYNGRAAIELAYEKEPTRSPRENWKKSRDYVRTTFGW
ncbi:sugar phosphate isomerase/epimerase [Fulvivirgaceae bacterium PWU5]|uniref:Sugar phosphate isomerase/epimerase n=1 Tax=Dawidia cretensis TaxID=2782350 RepID=A0AAP2E4D1_9BACT|nr:sugar phosphate isomerase/epimerase [Dawidia cretensis]MBT1711984.1 sugar phosphate isomerase/epimerase [Dawidia cretensis]